jgi:hypothetical protein
MGSKRSSIFAEAFPVSRVPKILDFLLPMSETNNFSDGLTPSGLSVNHDTFSENIQSIERRTRLRRAEPRYWSQVLGESFQYRQEQLNRKARRRLLDDSNLSLKGKTKDEQGLAYFREVEKFLKTPNLIVREDGRMNH